MKYPIALLATTLSVLLVGCTPAKLVQPEPTAADQQAEVIIYRDGGYNAGGVQMIFGEEERDYVILKNDEWKALQLDSGTTDLFVRSNQGDKPFYLTTELPPSERKCFRAYANPSNYAKALLLNLAYFFGNTFLMEEMDCPSEKTLAEKIEGYPQEEATEETGATVQ